MNAFTSNLLKLGFDVFGYSVMSIFMKWRNIIMEKNQTLHRVLYKPEFKLLQEGCFIITSFVLLQMVKFN